MIEEGLLLPMNVLLQGQKLTLLDPEMWFLRGNENKDVTLVITIGNNHQKLMVVEDILLLIDRSQIEVTAGKVIYHPLRIDILSKLLAPLWGNSHRRSLLIAENSWLCPKIKTIRSQAIFINNGGVYIGNLEGNGTVSEI